MEIRRHIGFNIRRAPELKEVIDHMTVDLERKGLSFRVIDHVDGADIRSLASLLIILCPFQQGSLVRPEMPGA